MRAALRLARYRAEEAGRQLAHALWATRAEVLSAFALMVGWGLLWWGVGDVLAKWVPARGLWAIGAGVFLLSCLGWKYLRTLATYGLYALSQADKS